VTVASEHAVDAYCASCDQDVEADAQTGRCSKCGKLATTHLPVRSLGEIRRDAGMKDHARAVVAPFDPTRTVARSTASQYDSEPPAALSAPDLTRFRLPSSRPTQKWLEATRALLEGFTVSAAEAEQKAAALEAKIADQVAELKAEAMRLRNSARVITQLLEQVGVEAPVQVQFHKRVKSGPKPAGAWSQRHERCIDCGTTDRPHLAHGRCAACDVRWRKQSKANA